MAQQPACSSCLGTGETPTDYGSVDCPDCGGAGTLPSRSVLIDWRARDLERAIARGQPVEASDMAWLVTELRRARGSLTAIVSLAHDVGDGEGDAIASRIRFVANRALGLYDISEPGSASAQA